MRRIRLSARLDSCPPSPSRHTLTSQLPTPTQTLRSWIARRARSVLTPSRSLARSMDVERRCTMSPIPGGESGEPTYPSIGAGQSPHPITTSLGRKLYLLYLWCPPPALRRELPELISHERPPSRFTVHGWLCGRIDVFRDERVDSMLSGVHPGPVRPPPSPTAPWMSSTPWMQMRSVRRGTTPVETRDSRNSPRLISHHTPIDGLQPDSPTPVHAILFCVSLHGNAIRPSSVCRLLSFSLNQPILEGPPTIASDSRNTYSHREIHVDGTGQCSSLSSEILPLWPRPSSSPTPAAVECVT
ncbi:hypothetical protein EW146_g3575 [Bondarzewia mesenterica]|uniref:Uncharacterized protein n=1 Tax=Bondarzewia mesenterica TaxID=1095465 RepID=A0A4S4LX53_9AGAM|nr:hypothetical protein EW146_g3575 [Bondarzewia mesenterica]